MHNNVVPLIYHPIYSDLPLPEGHRYPINKYRLLYEEVERKYLRLAESPFVIKTPSALTVEQVQQVHCKDYVEDLVTGSLPAARIRRIGFPWTEQLIQRTLTSAGGTCLAAQQAMEYGLAIHLSGGYHHAHYDFGSGFCLFNDLIIAAQNAIEHGAEKVLIVDSDVHHGDGSATLAAGTDQIVTLSLHCEKNFPARKPLSDMDVPLSRGASDKEFLASFKQVVELAIRLHQPDLIIYDAGVDIHEDDELGYLQVTLNGVCQRDLWMLDYCRNKGIPVACVVGGGYRTEHSDLIPIHMSLIDAAYQQRSGK
ncbi:Histone deacetylase/AcuC/AphA family protein [Vibrio mediterranei AK1]|uniref:histone deacetylase family protein n=1 Tax=Vibrio mediterranei TaxID=689 RepID=UPI0001540040|nr:histone deacetylase [Vibrio mediterranei]EDL55109.1 Histone deacetylase/AcuC/AphA family protein [Vibrio mediterranei AK1]